MDVSRLPSFARESQLRIGPNAELACVLLNKDLLWPSPLRTVAYTTLGNCFGYVRAEN